MCFAASFGAVWLCDCHKRAEAKRDGSSELEATKNPACLAADGVLTINCVWV